MVSIDRVYLAKTNDEASPSNAPPFPAQSNDNLQANGCPSQLGVYADEPSEYADNEWVNDRRKKWKNQIQGALLWLQTRQKKIVTSQTHPATLHHSILRLPKARAKRNETMKFSVKRTMPSQGRGTLLRYDCTLHNNESFLHKNGAVGKTISLVKVRLYKVRSVIMSS